MRNWKVFKRRVIEIPIVVLVFCLMIPVASGAPAVSAQPEPSPILELAISGTARVVDYDQDIYVVGATTGELYVVNEAGEYTATQLLAGSINDVRIEFPFIAVAAGNTIIELSLTGLTPQELWRVTRPGSVVSTDLSEGGNYVAYLSRSSSVGIVRDGSVIASYPISGSWIAHWLDATNDMEFLAITAEVPPYGGTNTGVELYSFNGSSLSREWGRILVYDYETTEVRVSEAKDYIAVATSSGTIMNLLDLPTGTVSWQYDAAPQEQFACDGDNDLNYVIGGTQAWSAPYKWFILKNLGTSYDLLGGGNMTGAVNDLDATPDGSYFAFGSDAGEVILLNRMDDTVEEVFTLSGLPLIDAIEIGSNTLLVGGNGFVNLYQCQPVGILLIPSEEDTWPTKWTEFPDLKRGPGVSHILALNISKPIDHYGSFEERISSIKEQGGIAVLAHPDLLYTTSDSIESRSHKVIEVYNAVMAAKRYVFGWFGDTWDYMLEQRVPSGDVVWGIASDDAHVREDYGKTWVMVRASALDRDKILESIEDGNFYAVKGPSDDPEVIRDIGVAADNRTTWISLSRPMEGYISTGRKGVDKYVKLPASSTHNYTVRGDEVWVYFQFNVPVENYIDECMVWTQPFLVSADGVTMNPYEEDGGNWYKGQLHCHTTGSDAKWEEGDDWIPTPENVVQLYTEKGYDFLAITDHNRITIPGHLTMTTQLELTGGGIWQTASLKVVDWENVPVERIKVSGWWEWDGKTKEEEAQLTNINGEVVFRLKQLVLPFQTYTFGFVLEDAARPAWQWVGGDTSKVIIVSRVPGRP